MNLCIFIVSKNGEALSGYYKQSQKLYSLSQNLTLRSVESSVIEFSEQGERTLRSVESSVIEFSEQGERTSDP
ncbi:hypothetical protein [Leptospira santarosai]|uniref:hypothetical protein n=1 Tax=Leptospira santarosai TaxID=28183 RepID=UPI000518FCFD|nr:hypothetical protein [Leptospira santarosai]